jgi:two-component system sensor histidine kinase KdpD
VSVNGRKAIVSRGISYIQDYVGCPCSVYLEGKEIGHSAEAEAENSESRDFEIQSAAGSMGCLRVFGETDERRDMLITAVATQLGIALYREQLREEQENIRIAMDRELQRSTMLRSVAHDLRSPLTALSGAGNLLADNYDNLSDVERKKLAADISEETLWLTNLVENILNMTRIGDQQLRLSIQSEVVDDLVSEAVSHARRLLNGRKFTATLPQDVVMVPVDGKLIVQVIINLLENAVRHTPPEAEISLTVAEKDGSVEISVTDTGDGIPAGKSEKVFDRFVTLDRGGITDGKRGLGLGLAICKAIAEAHGGAIRVADNKPRGTVFTVSLPTET